jgi:hypothetical protein
MQAYFDKVMELNDKYNPIAALASGNIHPNDS